MASTINATTSGVTVTGSLSAGLNLLVSGSAAISIGAAGQIGIGGANYGTSGQVLTSNGSSAAPSWQTGGISTGKAIAMAIVFGG